MTVWFSMVDSGTIVCAISMQNEREIRHSEKFTRIRTEHKVMALDGVV